jgi:predicted dehydrogenase
MLDGVSSVLRVGIVGAGIGAAHAAGLQRQDGVEIAAVCTRRRERAERMAARYRIPAVYTDHQEMLAREQLDLVVIATPNDLHYPLTLDALASGAHVVCEKPLALTVDEAREMERRAEAAGAKAFVPFVLRYLPAAAYVKEILDSGFIGEPYLVAVHCWTAADRNEQMHWHFDREQAGSGALANIGSHVIHLVDWWLGGLTRVCSKATTAVPQRVWPDGTAAAVDVDDTVAFLGELRNGAAAVFSVSMVTLVQLCEVRIEIFGSDGAVSFIDDWGADDAMTGRVQAMRREDHVRARVPIPDRLVGEFTGAPDFDSPFRGNFGRMAAEWVKSVRGQDAPGAATFRDGVRVQEVMDAVLRSSAEERWVDIEYGAATPSGRRD